MIYDMYSIYDRVAGNYCIPFAQHNEATAVRYFNMLIDGNDYAIPTDYDLFHVGTFDSEKCLYVPDEKPVFVVRGVIKVNPLSTDKE